MGLSNRGLSLVELMVSTAIVGLLSSVAVPSYNKYISEARMSEGVRYMGQLRQEQTTAYARSMMSGDYSPRYADRFVSLQPSRQILAFRVSQNARFDAIIGTANASFGGFLEGESVAQSDLPDSVFNDDFALGLTANRENAGFGAYDLANGEKDFAMAVVGDIDGDPEYTMFISTRHRPLMMACNDLEGTGSATAEWASAVTHTSGSSGMDLSNIVPNCTPTDTGCTGSCGL